MGERRVGVAVDFSIGSRAALQWAIDNVVRKEDHLILVTIRPDGDYEQTEVQLWEATGSPTASYIFNQQLQLIGAAAESNGLPVLVGELQQQRWSWVVCGGTLATGWTSGGLQSAATTAATNRRTATALIPLTELRDPNIMKKYATKPDLDTLDIVSLAATQKEVVVLMKIFWGDPREKLCEAVDNIPLDYLVIGNRGLGKLKRAIMGSVSNYVVNHSSCPVTVVKHA